jgi:hypothetical protein
MSHRPGFERAPVGLSKRAAQRLIQRAFVLAGRSRNVRQHIREADFGTVWTIEDWDLEWAVAIRRGKLDFDRRRPSQSDIHVTWATAEDFFEKQGKSGVSSFRYDGSLEARRIWEVVYAAFRAALNGLLLDPVDEDGRSLA